MRETLDGQRKFKTLVYLASQNIHPSFVEVSADHVLSVDSGNFVEDLLWNIKSHCRLYRLAAHFVLKTIGSQFYFITIQYRFLRCVDHLRNFSFVEQTNWCDIETVLQFPSQMNNGFINVISFLQSKKNLTRFKLIFTAHFINLLAVE